MRLQNRPVALTVRLVSVLHPMLIMELVWLAYWQLWEDTPLQPNDPVAWECLEDIECPNHVAKNLVSGCITSKPPSSTTLDNTHLWLVHLVYLVFSPQVLWLASLSYTICKVLTRWTAQAPKPPSSNSGTGRWRMANAIHGKSSEHGLNLSGS